MRIGQVFTYRGPFPWQCCLCPALVRAGDQAVHYWHGTRFMLAHEPGACLDYMVVLREFDSEPGRLASARKTGEP